MPSQTRSQRRRQQQRTQRPIHTSRPAQPAPELIDEPLDESAAFEELAAPVEPELAAPAPTPRKQRRIARPASEPVDYSLDYQLARHDLRRIAILSILLLAAMIALRLSGVV